jgi:hypothetical protein
MTRSTRELDLFLRFMQLEPGREAHSSSATPESIPVPPGVMLRDVWSLIDGSPSRPGRPDRSRP